MGHAESTSSGRRIRGLDAVQRREQRRRRLLESALELFATQGYQNTSIEQICQNAYVGTKGFYEIFEGREACYIALLQQISEEVKADLVDRLETAPDDARAAERMLIDAFAHALVDDPRRATVTFGQGSGISPAVERIRRANRRWAAGFVESLWRRYHLLDDTAQPGAHSAAIGLVGGLFDLIADWLLDADPHSSSAIDNLIRDLQAFYLVVRNGVAGSGS